MPEHDTLPVEPSEDEPTGAVSESSGAEEEDHSVVVVPEPDIDNGSVKIPESLQSDVAGVFLPDDVSVIVQNDTDSSDVDDVMSGTISDLPSVIEEHVTDVDSSRHIDTASDSAIVSSETVDDSQEAVSAFEDLSLAEAIGLFFRSPGVTHRAMTRVLFPDRDTEDVPEPLTQVLSSDTSPNTETERSGRQRFRFGDVNLLQLGLYIVAFMLALVGTGALVNVPGRTEETALTGGASWLLAGFLVWILSEMMGSWQGLNGWWQQTTRPQRVLLFVRGIPVLIMLAGIAILVRSTDEPPENVLTFVAPGVQLLLAGALIWFLLDLVITIGRRIAANNPGIMPAWMQDAVSDHRRKSVDDSDYDQDADWQGDHDGLPWYTQIHPVRIFLATGGMVLSILVWVSMSAVDNQLSTLTFYAWITSLVCWSLALAPQDWNMVQWVQAWRQRIRQVSFRQVWMVALVFLAIMALATTFRLMNLTGPGALPQEMTSDHVEKILDSHRVLNGSRNIFFANNGGREPFQMYAMAMFSQLPGQGMNHDSLKLLAVLEGLLTIPFLFWMGYEIIGYHNRRLGVLVGLSLSALVAASYWHTSVTRLGLRIVLTPLVTSLLLVYLARAMRENNRADFIKAGLILGFGLYTYQAVRMLPVVIVVGVAIAFYFGTRNIRQRVRYVINLAVLVFISFMVFLPLFNYSVQHPDEFWRRTAGRLLGDDVITETLADGTIVERTATLEERLDAFNSNVPVLMDNLRNAVLMFNWKGDVAWINGYPNHPAMDLITGALFILGLAAWLVWLIRQRDTVLWLMPVTLFIMLLPSALSIAYPIENPSFTRTSGAIPLAYLIAALPMALIAERILRVSPGMTGRVVAVIVCSGAVLLAYSSNASVYFNQFRRSYAVSSLPYTDAGRVLRGFAISDGAYGNAFMIAYPFWWDHRAVGIAGGAVDWPNGIVSLSDVPSFLQQAYDRPATDPYRLDPTRDLLFFYALDDDETAAQLQAWFPQGYERLEPSYQEGDNFMLYRVPAPGFDALESFFQQELSVEVE